MIDDDKLTVKDKKEKSGENKKLKQETNISIKDMYFREETSDKIEYIVIKGKNIGKNINYKEITSNTV